MKAAFGSYTSLRGFLPMAFRSLLFTLEEATRSGLAPTDLRPKNAHIDENLGSIEFQSSK